ncbi:MAG TPA: cytochrome b N-terminal domain-containing protein [Pyrinomonadaceae bacterium]|nr:cytochrome b N-terminal domain-containing protein [Pyrinomonadaceae bacterium]
MSDKRASKQTNEKDACTFVRHTTLGLALSNLLDEPSRGLDAWARTTAGLVALLLALQLVTGVLLAFYYVPSADSAYTTVAYVEKVLPAGSWIRALHFYGSQLLPAALVLHLAQMLWRGAQARRPVAWIASVALLALSLANGATGYSLPWDARAFFSTNIAENVTGGLPLVGATLRAWLVGGSEISTLTLSRFFALHALVLPFLILTTIVARLFIFRDQNTHDASAATPDEAQSAQTTNARPPLTTSSLSPHPSSLSFWLRAQLARNAVVVGIVFIVLALYAAKYPAPFGPSADSVPADYLPRPGAQFLWLFELLKHAAGASASFIGLVLPGLIFALLALAPWLDRRAQAATAWRRRAPVLLVGLLSLLVLSLTALALFDDAHDPRAHDQLARQTAAEEAFRRAPFIPQRARTSDMSGTATQTTNTTNANTQNVNSNMNNAPPAAYTQNCAKCHGAHGEGVRPNPKLIGIAEQPHRTVADIIAILNDPSAYGLQKPMTSFANKLTDDEKRQLAEWIEGLK